MRLPCARISFILLAIGLYCHALAQPSPPTTDSVILSVNEGTEEKDHPDETIYTIRNIIITGNDKTNPDIIMREISFEVNETYTLQEISKKFRRARKQLMNTGLFREVVVSLRSIEGQDVVADILVDEKWYIWPKPFLRTVDKNFQEWWSQGNRDMERINYGIRLSHNNFTGRNDKFRLNFMNGYTRQLSVQYHGLFLDNELKWSVNGGVSVGKNREVNYATEQNRPVPIRDNDRYLRTYFNWFGEISYRPAIKTRHTFGIGYNYEDVADTVLKLNPDFSSAKSTISYPELFYKLSYFDVDFIPYPTSGFIGEIILSKKGIQNPVQLWQLHVRGSKHWPVNKNYFFNASAVGMVKLPFRQPYITNQFLGHDGQYMQGYEPYVIDGVAGGFAKATLARQILSTSIGVPSVLSSHLGNPVPLKIFAKLYANAGYIHSGDPGPNQFNNQFLYSGGIGLDIIVFTDFVIKLDWSFNRLGENGLYLHKRNYF